MHLMKWEVFFPGTFRYLPKWKDHQICLLTYTRTIHSEQV